MPPRSILPFLALALAVAGCEEEYVPPPEPVRPVKMQEVQGALGDLVREYPGRIRAVQQADMAFEVGGRIIEFPVKEGDRVEEGALLARLDPRDYQTRVDSAQSDYDNSRINFERAQKLFEEGALSELNRDQRRTTMEINQAALSEAQKALEDTELRAPFKGALARKLVEDFQNVQAKEVVLVLQDDSALEIRVAVPERDLAGGRTQEIDLEAVTRRIKPRVVVTSLPDRQFPAELKQIAMLADPETRTFETTFVFPHPPGTSILPGMTAKVVIDLSTTDGIAAVRIPARAVVASPDESPFVWRVDPDSMKVSPRPVQVGELAGSEVEILAGLESGDLIATSGVNQLRDGMEVRRWQP